MCSLLTGCWSRDELTELAIVSASGIDWSDGEWEVSYQLVIPSAIASTSRGASSVAPISVLTTKGTTIREALSHIHFENTRELHTSHNRSIIIGESAAKKGIIPILDAYLRNPESRETVNVFISRVNARTIISQLLQLEKNTGEGIQKTIQQESENESTLPEIKIFDLCMQTAGDSKAAVLPEITVAGGGETKSLGNLESTTVGAKLKLGELAVLKSGRLAGWLTEDEAFGVSLIRNDVKLSTIPFNCNGMEKSTGRNSTFHLTKSTTKLKIQREEDHYVIHTHTKATGTLTETACKLDIMKAEMIRKMESNVQSEIIKFTEKGWEAVKGMKADVLGVADSFHRKYPKEWNKVKDRWDEVFAKMEFRPTVEVSIKQVGSINKSFEMIMEE